MSASKLYSTHVERGKERLLGLHGLSSWRIFKTFMLIAYVDGLLIICSAPDNGRL